MLHFAKTELGVVGTDVNIRAKACSNLPPPQCSCIAKTTGSVSASNLELSKSTRPWGSGKLGNHTFVPTQDERLSQPRKLASYSDSFSISPSICDGIAGFVIEGVRHVRKVDPDVDDVIGLFSMTVAIAVFLTGKFQ